MAKNKERQDVSVRKTKGGYWRAQNDMGQVRYFTRAHREKAAAFASGNIKGPPIGRPAPKIKPQHMEPVQKYTMTEELTYGNPAMESIHLIANSMLLKSWVPAGRLAPLLEMPYPADDKTIQHELQYLVQLADAVDSARLEVIKILDTNLFDVMSEYLASYGIQESKELIYQKLSLYEPIIDYLKLHFNRPRPFQTAGFYGIPLYPLIKTDASDSSYPSGHTLFALYFYHIYGNVHPELRPELMRFVLDVKLSREQGGLHYPSDGLFSFKVYRHICRWMNPMDVVAPTPTNVLAPLKGYVISHQ